MDDGFHVFFIHYFSIHSFDTPTIPLPSRGNLDGEDEREREREEEKFTSIQNNGGDY
jgi:hypothetical protein